MTQTIPAWEKPELFKIERPMKNSFAKLFNLNDHQVVVYKQWNEEDQRHEVIVLTDTGYSIAKMVHSWSDGSEANAQEFFSHFEETDAEAFVQKMAKLVG